MPLFSATPLNSTINTFSQPCPRGPVNDSRQQIAEPSLCRPRKCPSYPKTSRSTSRDLVLSAVCCLLSDPCRLLSLVYCLVTCYCPCCLVPDDVSLLSVFWPLLYNVGPLLSLSVERTAPVLSDVVSLLSAIWSLLSGLCSKASVPQTFLFPNKEQQLVTLSETFFENQIGTMQRKILRLM
jgi:hypothetical protein